METSLKSRTAKSLKWNVVDRLSTQLLYAVTGVVLARELSEEAFGLVGAILVFQAFAMLFVDSGFSFALIQRKRPTELGYSSVFWFNLGVATAIYAILFVTAPWIADLFGGDARLIPLSRVMFLSFIINAAAIVQTNRLAKQMNFRPIALINIAGLAAGSVIGIWMALTGWEAWAIVWQTITINGVKCVLLWIYCRWWPMMCLSWTELRSYFKVGNGMMMTSFLNVLFQNIYAAVIGNRTGMVPLGYYTQADKWSKMGVTAVSQVLTSSFLPTLSEVQDDDERFRRVVGKMNRFTAYLLFPAMFFLIVMAQSIFHVLFGTKWDASIVLFQLLLVRGIFTVLTSLYNNYMLALGHSRAIFRLEVFRDVIAIVGIVATLPYITLSTSANIVLGLEILLWGQVVASLLTFIVSIIVTARTTGISSGRYLLDLLPYFGIALTIAAAIYVLQFLGLSDILTLIIQAAVALTLYLGINAILPSRIQHDILAQLRHPNRPA